MPRKIAATSSGFVYYMSVTGITGERSQLPPELVDNVRELRQSSGQPVVVGFGISTAEGVWRTTSTRPSSWKRLINRPASWGRRTLIGRSSW